MSEDRLVDIEVKLAHQEQLLTDLDDVVTKQQAKIMQLEELCSSLVERIRSVSEGTPGDGPQDERPPHY